MILTEMMKNKICVDWTSFEGYTTNTSEKVLVIIQNHALWVRADTFSDNPVW